MSMYVSSIAFFETMYSTWPFHKLSNYTANVLISILSTLFIAWEPAHRRNDIAYFVGPRTLESIWNMLSNRKLVRSEYHG